MLTRSKEVILYIASEIMEFEKGVTATFNLSAFTDKTHRTIKIMGTKGEIRGDDRKNILEVLQFGKEENLLIEPLLVAGGHGGGDTGIMNDFVSLLNNKNGTGLTSAEISVESHVMAFAAEESRVREKVIFVDGYYKSVVVSSE